MTELITPDGIVTRWPKRTADIFDRDPKTQTYWRLDPAVLPG